MSIAVSSMPQSAPLSQAVGVSLTPALPVSTDASSQPVVIEYKRKTSKGEEVVVKRYLKGKLLGKGGFAKCYEVTCLATGLSYAMKIVPRSTLVKRRAKEKLQTEIKIHRTLQHQHIVGFNSFFEDKENVYIVLELCHNHTLSELMRRKKRFSEDEARKYMLQMLDAIHYCHTNAIIHRDLKLGNLFLDTNWDIKMGDFGLAAKLEDHNERKRTVCGTPNYIAPEILENSKSGHSYQVDVWSLGVILYTMLVGRPPYESRDVKSTYRRILANCYCFPDHVPISEHAQGLITRMLQTAPDLRPSLEDILNHAFMRQGGPIRTFPKVIAIRSASTNSISTTNTNSTATTVSNTNTTSCSAPGNCITSSSGEQARPHLGPPTRLPLSSQNTNALPPARASTLPSKRLAVDSSHTNTVENVKTTHVGTGTGFSVYPDSGLCGRATVVEHRKTSTVSSARVSSEPTHDDKENPLTQQQTVVSNKPSTAGEPLYKAQPLGRPTTSSGRYNTRSSSTAAPSHGSQSTTSSLKSVAQDTAHTHASTGVSTGTAGSRHTTTATYRGIKDLTEQKGSQHIARAASTGDQGYAHSPAVTTRSSGSNATEGNLRPPPARREQPRSSSQDTQKGGQIDHMKVTPTSKDSVKSGSGSSSKSSNSGSLSSKSEPQVSHDTLEVMVKKLTLTDNVQMENMSPTLSKPSVWVSRYVDYTAKYGLGYLLSDGSGGVYFNDATKIVMRPDGVNFMYFERSTPKVQGGVGIPYTMSNYPPALQKKALLLNHFRHYLLGQEKRDAEAFPSGPSVEKLSPTSCNAGASVTAPSLGVNTRSSSRNMQEGGYGQGDAACVYVKKWVRTRHAILFRLSNKTVQIVFFDKTELLLSDNGNTVTYVSKDGNRSMMPHSKATDRGDVSKRLTYALNMMAQLLQSSQPGGNAASTASSNSGPVAVVPTTTPALAGGKRPHSSGPRQRGANGSNNTPDTPSQPSAQQLARSAAIRSITQGR